MKTFKDKVVIITGGSSGIGKTTALLFAKYGANIVITFKDNKKGAEEAIKEAKTEGVKAIAIKADLNIENEAKKVVEEAIKEYGKIDILVNNAGRYIEGDEWNGPSDVWIQSLKQNLVSAIAVSKYVIPIFQKQRSGVIVNVSSRHGVSGHSDAIAYSAAKAGVINITQSYAELLAPFGRANSVSPSATNAGYWLTAPEEELQQTLNDRPNHKLVEPETIAEKIVFLASDESSNINGENFLIKE